MKSFLLLFLFISISIHISATDLKISNVALSDDGTTIEATVEWSNAWNSQRNHDAVWLFFKFEGRNGFDPIKISSENTKVNNASVRLKVTPDQMGVFISLEGEYRGDIKVIISLSIDESYRGEISESDRVQAYGIEMVYIPEGAFALGEPGEAYLEYGGLFKSDASGKPAGLYAINSGDQKITIGAQEGALYYNSKTGYEGDQQGELNSDFPTGFHAFYIMKYEPTQGQYVDFLNTLSEQQSHHRANFGGKQYYDRRGSIRIENNTYLADHPDRACNFMSWDDSMAYADWAGLRPMTELEFVKACRGLLEPQTNEFPWNSNTHENIKRVMTETGDLAKPDENTLTDENRSEFGASYYWVMDLAGSMWERVVSIGSERGRAFFGEHGNGLLTSYGFADNNSWPSGVDGPGGFGYRGGGYYIYPMNFTEFNPYSPIAYRRFGGWSGGNRKEAYGARFVRTAE